MTCQIGDWVAFVRDNHVLHGCVLHRSRREAWAAQVSDEHTLTTTAGQVNESAVLERRAAPDTNTLKAQEPRT